MVNEPMSGYSDSEDSLDLNENSDLDTDIWSKL